MAKPIKRFTGQYRWLSNFWLCPVKYNDELWASAEHAYQAAKAYCAGSQYYVNYIRLVKSAGEAKQLGRKIFMSPNWDNLKLWIMRNIVMDKFTRNKDLYVRLLDTGEAHIEEGNNWGDQFYGVCKGEGCNHLGKILMEVRSTLYAEQQKAKP